MTRRSFFSLAILAAVPLWGTACLATRNDIRLLQQDIRVLQGQTAEANEANAQQIAALGAATARGDSVLRVQIQQVLANLVVLGDSIRRVSDRLSQFKAEYSADKIDIQTSLLQLQERVGVSQQQLAQLRDRIEQSRAATVARDSATSAPPASQTYTTLQTGISLNARSQFANAREAFQAVLAATDVTPDWAAAALNGIGATYGGEGKRTTADSVYQLVVQRYPRSVEAPNALYKHGDYVAQDQPARARPIFQKVIADYPTSEAARLARDKLATIPTAP